MAITRFRILSLPGYKGLERYAQGDADVQLLWRAHSLRLH